METNLTSGPQAWILAAEAPLRSIDRDELQRMLAQTGVQLVDVLPANEYEQDHLPGAISLPMRHIEKEALTRLDPSRPVIVYCFDGA